MTLKKASEKYYPSPGPGYYKILTPEDKLIMKYREAFEAGAKWALEEALAAYDEAMKVKG